MGLRILDRIASDEEHIESIDQIHLMGLAWNFAAQAKFLNAALVTSFLASHEKTHWCITMSDNWWLHKRLVPIYVCNPKGNPLLRTAAYTLAPISVGGQIKLVTQAVRDLHRYGPDSFEEDFLAGEAAVVRPDWDLIETT